MEVRYHFIKNKFNDFKISKEKGKKISIKKSKEERKRNQSEKMMVFWKKVLLTSLTGYQVVERLKSRY